MKTARQRISEVDALRVDILRGRVLSDDEQLELLEELRHHLVDRAILEGVDEPRSAIRLSSRRAG